MSLGIHDLIQGNLNPQTHNSGVIFLSPCRRFSRLYSRALLLQHGWHFVLQQASSRQHLHCCRLPSLLFPMIKTVPCCPAPPADPGAGQHACTKNHTIRPTHRSNNTLTLTTRVSSLRCFQISASCPARRWCGVSAASRCCSPPWERLQLLP